MEINDSITKNNIVLPSFSKLDIYEELIWDKVNKPYNSEYADEFHRDLKACIGLNVCASDVKIVINRQIQIRLWIDDFDNSETILTDKFYVELKDQAPLFNQIREVLYNFAEKNKFSLPAKQSKPEKTLLKRFFSDSDLSHIPQTTIMIYSFNKKIRFDILRKSVKKINYMLKQKYPLFNVECICSSITRKYENINHIFIFPYEHDITRAKEKEILDLMKTESLTIVREYDPNYVLADENYNPDIIAKENYDSEFLFNLYRN